MPEIVRCPICRKEARWQGNSYRPFCSERCKLQDLGAWASERYAIRGKPIDEATEPRNADPSDDEDGE
jgi:endogenous inhibitor of DNA gyrase (YacG/DUF329 family)